MYKYFLYRYIDDTTKEIVYIGKTQQLDVINRIDQHKTDNVGKWTQNNKFHIEFISVPREEDMNYIESFLIRKFQPKLNIVLSNNDKPEFNIYIPENLWINLDDYLTQKAEINEKPKTIISENITQIAQANSEFKLNVNDFYTDFQVQPFIIEIVSNHFKRISFDIDYILRKHIYSFYFNRDLYKRLAVISHSKPYFFDISSFE